MSGVVDRRNDPGFWGPTVKWTRLRNKHLPVCEDCLTNTHENHGAGRLERARWRRWVLEADGAVHVCDPHRREWEKWTPGQTEISAS